MKCPDCKSATEIVDTQKFDTVVWRRRRCLSCKGRFSTHEVQVEEKQKSRVVLQPEKAEPKPKVVNLLPRPTPKPKPAPPKPVRQPAPVSRLARQVIEDIREAPPDYEDY